MTGICGVCKGPTKGQDVLDGDHRYMTACIEYLGAINGDLLAALKAFVDVMDKHGEWVWERFYYGNIPAQELCGPIETAAAVIKRAEGRA
jgi:hypothetical protein